MGGLGRNDKAKGFAEHFFVTCRYANMIAVNAPFPLTSAPVRFRISVDNFELLDRSGSFREYAKTELLDGTIYAMNAQHRPHARAKGLLYRALGDALAARGSALEVLTEVSVAMPPENMPEPDLVVTSAPGGEGPVPLASVALLIEIADTTLSHDLGPKAAVYAANGVPEYWVVDLEGRVVHQMWSPSGEAYGEKRATTLDERIAAATIEGLAVETAGI